MMNKATCWSPGGRAPAARIPHGHQEQRHSIVSKA